MKKKTAHISVIGGGAAGFFAAVNIAEQCPQCKVTIIEKTARILDKVRISGGGRCNVTHACFDAKELCKNYPRGSRELIGPFMQFQPADTIAWFKQRGTHLKTEADGRMFPTSDTSQTIIDCLTNAAQKAGVAIITQTGIVGLCRQTTADNNLQQAPQWQLTSSKGEKWEADAVLVATGSSPRFWEILKGIGITIVPPVPSLFTFHVRSQMLHDLAGISLPNVMLTASNAPSTLKTSGPLLITHQGISGPAVLRLSAWGARFFCEQEYRFPLQINWTGHHTPQEMSEQLHENRQLLAKKQISANSLYHIPARLWRRLIEAVLPNPDMKWADLSNKQINDLVRQLTQCDCYVDGKSTFKEEFVTCGGVKLSEIDFKTMECKQHKGLFFAGEVLDIDAITGGFNFQAAWTTGFIAASAIVKNLSGIVR